MEIPVKDKWFIKKPFKLEEVTNEEILKLLGPQEEFIISDSIIHGEWAREGGEIGYPGHCSETEVFYYCTFNPDTPLLSDNIMNRPRRIDSVKPGFFHQRGLITFSQEDENIKPYLVTKIAGRITSIGINTVINTEGYITVVPQMVYAHHENYKKFVRRQSLDIVCFGWHIRDDNDIVPNHNSNSVRAIRLLDHNLPEYMGRGISQPVNNLWEIIVDEMNRFREDYMKGKFDERRVYYRLKA